MSGVHVLHSGRTVAVLPPGATISPKSLLLLRFSETSVDTWDPKALWTHGGSVDIPVTSETTAPADRPSAGWLSLERPVEGEDELALMDYVRWGHARLPSDSEYFPRAMAIGAWSRGGFPVYIGLERTYGDPAVPRNAAVIIRYSFDSESDRGKTVRGVVAPEDSTPGYGNSFVPKTVFLNVADGSGRYLGGVNIVIARPPIPYAVVDAGGASQDDLPYRVQMALDPHFENVLIDLKSKSHSVHFAEKDLRPGIFFFRARMDGVRFSSEWSETIALTLRRE